MTKKITIGGQQYLCVLTIGVLKKLKDKTGKDLQDMKDVFSICTLLFMAAVASSQKEKQTFPWDSAEALMDDIELSEIETITNELFGVVPSAGEGEKKWSRKHRPRDRNLSGFDRPVAVRYLLPDTG